MKKTLFGIALLVLALAPLFGATCVSGVRQKGPAGPWVGEVTNTGSVPMRDVIVNADIFDATGRNVGRFDAYTCPGTLMPGETGAFEILWPTDIVDVTPPLRAEVAPLADSYEWNGYPSREGLVVREIERNVDERYVLAEITNASAWTYNDLYVCGTLRTPDGALSEVGSAALWPVQLSPGESHRFPLFFNTIHPGPIEFFPVGSNICCPSNFLEIAPSNFSATASRVVSDGAKRTLEVLGEVTNPYDFDLDGLTMSAHLRRSLSERVDQQYGGCNGRLPANGKASIILRIPLKGAGTPNYSTLVADSIAAFPPYASYLPPVSNLRLGREVDGTREVFATISNPTSSWIAVNGICFNLRDGGGRLVGTNHEGGYYNYIAPGGSVTLSAFVSQFDDASSAEAIAFAQPQDGPPQVVVGPDY